MKPQPETEYVLVFPTQMLHTNGYFEGLSFCPASLLEAIETSASFRPRAVVETDPQFKQLIPYVIVAHGDTVLSYRRGLKSAEGRLTGSRSIGIGGHVSSRDPNLLSATYIEAMNREIREELKIESAFRIVPVAALNDDSDEVGRVHFGLIHLLILEEPRVQRNEQAIADIRFLSKSDLVRSIAQYESWSQVCIRSLDRIFAAAATLDDPHGSGAVNPQ